MFLFAPHQGGQVKRLPLGASPPGLAFFLKRMLKPQRRAPSSNPPAESWEISKDILHITKVLIEVRMR